MAELDTLRKRRTALGLSQEAFGEAIGVEGMTVSRWERGESFPQRRFWPDLEKITGLPITAIIKPEIVQ
jgi:transcriptional regulator with XRE-family HTH domain